MSRNGDSNANNQADIEALYAKPIKTKRRAPSITSGQSEQIYDRLDRQPSSRVVKRDSRSSTRSNQKGPVHDDAISVESAPRSVVSQSAPSAMSTESNEDNGQYPMEMLDTKDTNDVIKELRKLGLGDQSDRLVLALRSRFELEGDFIKVCASDGVTVVEGDDDEVADHQSIGGLRVKGITAKYVNYDEYDPEVIEKYGHFDTGYNREEMANDAATLRRQAANILWTVENMERMIDPNSRVRYIRHEGDE